MLASSISYSLHTPSLSLRSRTVIAMPVLTPPHAWITANSLADVEYGVWSHVFTYSYASARLNYRRSIRGC